MVGHKVRCQCGFVFRLGPKQEKQPGVAREIRRREKLKQALRAKNKQAGAAPVRPKEVPNPGIIKPVPATPLPDSQEEIIDGVPLPTPPKPTSPVPAQPIPTRPATTQPYPAQPYPGQPPAPQPYPSQPPSGYFQPNPLVLSLIHI